MDSRLEESLVFDREGDNLDLPAYPSAIGQRMGVSARCLSARCRRPPTCRLHDLINH